MTQFEAAVIGDLERVRELVTMHNVNDAHEHEYGETLLHKVCRHGHAHIVPVLVKLGANVNARDNYGWTPIVETTNNSHARCIQLLIDAGADASIASPNGDIPLHAATNSYECTALLLHAYPAGVYVTDRKGQTALHFAVLGGSLKVVLLLLDANSPLDPTDFFGRTPLYYALRHGHNDIAKALLDRGAQTERLVLDVYLPSIPKWVVLFMACRNACRSSSYAMLELARRRSSVIGGNRRDVLGLIARFVWASRREELWKRKTHKRGCK